MRNPKTFGVGDPEWRWGFDQRIRLGFITKNLRTVRRARILDLGCGSGRLGRSFEAYNDVVYLDVSEYYVRRTGNGVQADATRLPFRKGSFEYVVSSDVLEHLKLDDRSSYLLEACRVGTHEFLFTFSTLCSSSRGAALFEVWFAVPRMVLPRWYAEHNMLPMPRNKEIFGFLTGRGVRYNKCGYQGLLNIALLGFRTSFSRLMVRGTTSRFAHWLAAVLTRWIDLISYLVVRWSDVPPYASCFAKVDLTPE